jgi:transcriptional regulator with XRE-family HTH domain
MKIHIGEKIKEVFEEKGLKMSSFSSSVGMTYRNIYRIFEKEHINTELLQKISKVLDYNFFNLYIDEDSNLIQEPQEKYITRTKEKENQFELSVNIKFNDDSKKDELLELIFGKNIPVTFS